jgi:NhaP-type Na+/H+ or K+/H+ antiporter
MSEYLVLITVIGIAALGMVWVPFFTERTNVSYSILYVIAGATLYSFIDALPFPDPIVEGDTVLRLTEMVVIISLMGSGLKIDQPFSFQSWKVPFRLVTITMMLSILAVTLVAHVMFGLGLPASLLLGAALAPTDPVLASDVQVGPPLEKTHDNIRFSLTAEAGMNDGMAFPFTWLAIALSMPATFTWNEWILHELFLKIIIGIACGYVIGQSIAHLVFRVSKNQGIGIRDGFLAICATLITYGITEMLHGYGFVAVFIAAISIRNFELHHNYHVKMHSFTDQIERILLAVVLILFGGSIMHFLFKNISWPIVFFSLLCIFVIRPVTAWLALFSTGFHKKEKLAISFFGIKGIGSFFYLSFALAEGAFSDERYLWSIVSCVVLFSILIHGSTATYILKKLGARFETKK